MEAARSPKGVITKLFGAILMMLGVLDSLLTLRGGVPAYEFLMLIFIGAAVYAIGAVRAGTGLGEVANPSDAKARKQPGTRTGGPGSASAR